MGFMADQESNAAYYGGGGGGFSGAWSMIILVVVVLWLLFRDGNKNECRDGYGIPPYGAYGFGPQKCGVCVEDESNWQEDKHLTERLCGVNMNVTEQGCKDRETIHCDGDKTREYIAHLQERADDKAYNQLAMQLAQKDNYIQTLQLEKNFECKIDKLMGEVASGFCKTDRDIDRLACEVPKRQPVWAECVTPCVRDLDRGCERGEREFPRRGRFDGFCGCEC